ncbi:CidA/LrgA family protein [Paenibacillus sp. MY03]|uniref:CidA/LrgA family protein n=1 Tax=Paenibacillus sp. MY03 TaxID=302980 RepID=UPI0015C5D1C9|nr:CidA/LrgA family protein [Paenibacillus sp. MY03]
MNVFEPGKYGTISFGDDGPMRGIAILFFFLLLGTILERLAGIPLPGNVIGLLLLFLSLALGWVKLESVENVSLWLLKNMMLFFAPLIVGAMVFFPLFQKEWSALVMSLLFGTLSVVLATALTAKFWPERRKKE